MKNISRVGTPFPATRVRVIHSGGRGQASGFIYFFWGGVGGLIDPGQVAEKSSTINK